MIFIFFKFFYGILLCGEVFRFWIRGKSVGFYFWEFFGCCGVWWFFEFEFEVGGGVGFKWLYCCRRRGISFLGNCELDGEKWE